MRIVGRGDLQERTWAGIFSTYVTLDFLELGKWDSQVMTALLFDMYINYLQFLLLQCCYESRGYTLS